MSAMRGKCAAIIGIDAGTFAVDITMEYAVIGAAALMEPNASVLGINAGGKQNDHVLENTTPSYVIFKCQLHIFVTTLP